MQIGELAKQAGVTVQAVRFYERRGLLPPPPRKDSGYRIYGDSDLRRLAFIRQAKRLGFSLGEIKTVLKMRQRGACPCGEVMEMAQRHLAETEEQVRNLTRFRDQLSLTLCQWKQSKPINIRADAICALIERTIAKRQTLEDEDQTMNSAFKNTAAPALAALFGFLSRPC